MRLQAAGKVVARRAQKFVLAARYQKLQQKMRLQPARRTAAGRARKPVLAARYNFQVSRWTRIAKVLQYNQIAFPAITHRATFTSPVTTIFHIEVEMEGAPVNGGNKLKPPLRVVDRNPKLPQIWVFFALCTRNIERIT